MHYRDRAVAVLTALVLAGCATQAAPPAVEQAMQSMQSAYQKSIALAAVKSPDAVRPLTPITDSQVTVSHLQFSDTVSSKEDLWVALPSEVKALCAGKPDALLALQMALGMPPRPSDKAMVFQFTVRSADVFRPCASSSSISASTCALDFNLPSSDPHRPFVLKQMMESYRTRGGYPFTGMGWTYNWDPAAQTPMGVSEYIVRKGARLDNVTKMTPAQFCGSTS
jgi:hypothetical protein